MKHTIGLFVIALVGCSSNEGGGDAPPFGQSCPEEFNDGPQLFVADCPAEDATWEEFDESCGFPLFEAVVTDETGNVVVDFESLSPSDGFSFALPNLPGVYQLAVSANGYEPVATSVCLTAYDGCHVTEHFCDQAVDVNDMDSHWKPFLLIDLMPAPLEVPAAER